MSITFFGIFMDKQVLQWREKNSLIAYPLEENDSVPNSFILDACFFLPPPVYLESIEKVPQGIIITILSEERLIRFYYKGVIPYAYTDYGKICLGNVDRSIIDCHVKFLETVCSNDYNLSLMSLKGDIDITTNGQIDAPLDLTLNETTEFKYECISSINGQSYEHFVLGRDDCTEINMYPGQALIMDICKPPCYGCNERLTTGDMNILMESLETRVTELEAGHHTNLKSHSKTIDFSYESPDETNIIDVYENFIIRSINIVITEAFNSGVLLEIGIDSLHNKYVSTSDMDLTRLDTLEYMPYSKVEDDETVKLFLSGSARTAGRGYLVFEYFEKTV